MNNNAKNKQLYLKVLIGVLVVGLIGTLFFLMNKSKSNNAADITGSKDGENSNSDTIPANNYFGLDFLEYGVDEEGYASIYLGIVDCDSNYLGSDATYKDIQQLIESGCKITYDEPFRFSNDINAEDLSYKIDNSSSNNNENLVISTNNEFHQVYLKKDTSNNKYFIQETRELDVNTLTLNDKIFFDDNLINLLLFNNLGNSSEDVFGLMALGKVFKNYQVDSDNRIIRFNIHNQTDMPGDYAYTAIESVNYKDGKIYEIIINDTVLEGTYKDVTKFPVEGCLRRHVYNGTYRFVYDDLGLLRSIVHVMPDGNLDILSYFVYYPVDPKPQDLACNIQYNQN